MAFVSECTSCGLRREVPQTPCASCGGLGAWERIEVEDPVVAPAQEADGQAADEADEPDAACPAVSDPNEEVLIDGCWTCERCGRENAASRADCIECASVAPGGVAPASRGLAITGDGGEHLVAPGGQMFLGRRAAVSPAARRLASFPNVGRQHALVAVDTTGRATITDLGSANGTWLVEASGLRRLPSGQPVPVSSPALVQLGNSPTGPNARLTLSEKVSG